MSQYPNKWYMVIDPYGEADRSTGGKLEMANDLFFRFMSEVGC